MPKKNQDQIDQNRKVNQVALKSQKSDRSQVKKHAVKKRRPLLIILDILIIVCIIGALYFFLEPKLRSKKQNEVEQEAYQQIQAQFDKPIETQGSSSNSNQTSDQQVSIAVDPEALRVPGEAYEDFGGGVIEEEYLYDANGNVIINFIGSLSIPKINLNTPIADDDTLVALRYGVGHTAESDPIGEPGRALLFGHWFQEYGRVFNRLEEIKEGDEFHIDILQIRMRYHYKVHKALPISHEDLLFHLFEEEQTVESEVILVTCMVRNNAWWAPTARYLVYGELVDSEFISPSGKGVDQLQE